ncbi:MAG TPA: ABC transporter ATP-binding protein [Bryobacteraceae bacterium]|nr:ABC transporter ATP-binding protein [Bryobacteraceae bacterium]
MAHHLTCVCRKRLPSGFTVDANLRIPLEQARVTVLFGPSGSGKTTLLRLLAGLDRPDNGRIQFRDQVWFDSTTRVSLAPQQRRAGFLFQDYALFPHLTVRRNVEFAAPHPGKAGEWLSRFNLTWLSPRLPREISGGEQQRVALARALAAEPALLLLDEPLSALDAATRTRLRHELRRNLVDGDVPSIIVTHDRTEALALGDWIAVLVGGAIRQAGPVEEVFRHPADVQVAESVGVENVIPGEVIARESGLATIRVGAARLESVDTGETGLVFACIRAEEVTLAPGAPSASSARNRLAGRIQSVLLEGPVARVEVDCGFPLVALVTAQSAADLQFRRDEPVSAVIKATSVHLLSR